MNKFVAETRKITKCFFIFFIFLNVVIPFSLTAQATALSNDYIIQVQQFGIENGLIHRSVHSVFEDRDGFIWIGTDKGLQRYDGHDFKTWTKADKTGLLYYISSIGQDDEGWLWLWNNDRLKFVFLHPETEEILSEEERFGADFPIHKRMDEPSFWDNGLSCLPKDSAGKFYFGTVNSQIISYSSQEGFQFHQLPLKANFFRVAFIDHQDHIWVVADKSIIYELSPQCEILNVFDLKEELEISTTQRLEASGFSQHRQGIYFDIIHFEKGVKQFSQLLKINENRKIHIVKNTTKLLTTIAKGKFWERIDTYWKIYDFDTNKLLCTLDKKEYDNSLFDSINRPFIDSRGRAWIYGQLGLNRVILQPNRFRKYLAFEDEDNKPFRNSARGLWVEKDSIFVNFEASYTISFDKNYPANWTILAEKESARPIARKENGDLWVGYPFQLKVISTQGKTLKEYPNNEKDGVGIWSFYEDKNGKYWIGGGDRLLYKNKEDDSLSVYQTNENDFGLTQRRGAIQNFIPENDNLLWFCSWTGLYLFDIQKEKVLARFSSDEEGNRYLPADLFYFLYKDKDGIYWLGTNEGLIRWEMDSGQWAVNSRQLAVGSEPPAAVHRQPSTVHHLFSRRDGLSNDVIYAVFEDRHNRLWLSSDYGIMSFDKSTFDVKTYLPKDGISHHEFNRTSQFQTEDGMIYFGGLNGITAFHPDDFVGDSTTYPKMLISDYEIFDGAEERLVNKVGQLRHTNTIVFHPDDRFFRLKFVLPTFEDVSKMLYAWKIEGVDEDWQYQKENSLQIGILPYGTHLLRVKGQNADGGWSPHELAIRVKVLKPFYLQTWFLLLAALLVAGGVYWLYHRKTRLYLRTQKLLETEIARATAQIQQDKQTIEIQAEELRQLDKVKSTFFANVSHELRTPLTLMLGPISSVLKSNELNNRHFTLLKKAQQSGKDLLKLIGSILDLSKMEARKMALNEQPHLLFPLVRRIASAFESHAQRKDIQFAFYYQAEKELQLELDKDKLEIILNNLLSNAIKFTPAKGKVTIQIEDFGNIIQIAVLDTGRGIHPDDLPHIFNRFYQSNQPDAPTEGGTGIGLALSQEFVKLMDGKIWAESQLGEGSCFFVQIPRKEILGMTEPIPKLESVGKPVSDNLMQQEAYNHSSRRSTILVVEDNHSLREYIQLILQAEYEVITAENGQVALEILSKTPSIDLITSDVMMPVMDGYQFLEKAKNDDKLRHLPFIMLTARADMQDKLKALRIGVDDYLLKPFEEEELLARIKNLLHHYEQRHIQARQKDKAADDAPPPPPISQEDQLWLENLETYLQEQLSNTLLNIPQIASDFAMSERSFQRQLKRLVGVTPSKYIQEIRLNKARQLLENRVYNNVSKVAYEVGFQNAKTFSRSYKKRFGRLPSGYF